MNGDFVLDIGDEDNGVVFAVKVSVLIWIVWSFSSMMRAMGELICLSKSLFKCVFIVFKTQVLMIFVKLLGDIFSSAMFSCLFDLLTSFFCECFGICYLCIHGRDARK